MKTELQEVRENILLALDSEMGYRKFRTVEDWIVSERMRVHEACEREAMRLGRSPPRMDEVAIVEKRALGHTDYAEKWSLYCAELVLGKFA